MFWLATQIRIFNISFCSFVTEEIAVSTFKSINNVNYTECKKVSQSNPVVIIQKRYDFSYPVHEHIPASANSREISNNKCSKKGSR